MPLSENELTQCLNAATAAAYRAGARLMKYFGKNLDIGSKGKSHLAGDVVTIADKEAQDEIFAILEDFHPDIGMLGEEEGQDENTSRFDKPYFWCVDPMDGTLPFLERANGFAASIGLVSREGDPLLGVCYGPALGDLYHAVKGGKAYRNGEVLECGVASGSLHMSLGPNDCIPPDRNAALNHILEGLKSLDRVQRIAPFLHAGAVVKACWVAELPPSCYFSFPREDGGASLWDFAASACIVRAAGGWVSDLYGNDPELNRRESTYMHHRGILYASDEELAQIAIERFADWTKTHGWKNTI